MPVSVSVPVVAAAASVCSHAYNLQYEFDKLAGVWLGVRRFFIVSDRLSVRLDGHSA